MLSVSIHLVSPSNAIMSLGAGARAGLRAGAGFERWDCFSGRFALGGRREMFKSNPLSPYT